MTSDKNGTRGKLLVNLKDTHHCQVPARGAAGGIARSLGSPAFGDILRTPFCFPKGNRKSLRQVLKLEQTCNKIKLPLGWYGYEF